METEIKPSEVAGRLRLAADAAATLADRGLGNGSIRTDAERTLDTSLAMAIVGMRVIAKHDRRLDFCAGTMREQLLELLPLTVIGDCRPEHLQVTASQLRVLADMIELAVKPAPKPLDISAAIAAEYEAEKAKALGEVPPAAPSGVARKPRGFA